MKDLKIGQLYCTTPSFDKINYEFESFILITGINRDLFKTIFFDCPRGAGFHIELAKECTLSKKEMQNLFKKDKFFLVNESLIKEFITKCEKMEREALEENYKDLKKSFLPYIEIQ